jgi:hypothetical protein
MTDSNISDGLCANFSARPITTGENSSLTKVEKPHIQHSGSQLANVADSTALHQHVSLYNFSKSFSFMKFSTLHHSTCFDRREHHQTFKIIVWKKLLRFRFLIPVFICVSFCLCAYRLCGLVVRVPGYRSRGPVSIPGATRFSEK